MINENMKDFSMNTIRMFTAFACLWLSCIVHAQESHTIVFNTGDAKPPAFLYAATARAEVQVGLKEINQRIDLQVRVLQGRGETISLGLGGAGDVTAVEGDAIAAWAVRTSGSERFLDIQLKPAVSEASGQSEPTTYAATVKLHSTHARLPTRVELAHLKVGKAVGFDSQIQIQYVGGASGKILVADGFASLASQPSTKRLQSSTGGRLELQIDRDSSLPPAIELRDTSLVGQLDASTKSVSFELKATAIVSEAKSRLRLLTGNVAIAELPASGDYQLELVQTEAGPAYDCVFAEPGTFPVSLSFVAGLKSQVSGWESLDFTVAAGAVVPVVLHGFDANLEFAREEQAFVPSLIDNAWHGFLPATGRLNLRLRKASSAAEGKSFFTTSSKIDVSVGPGLMRQEQRITYQILQGQLDQLSIHIVGQGEILSVEGDSIVGWKVTGQDDQRQLDITLNQPLSGSREIIVRSQMTLAEFPVRAEAMVLQPQGSIRNSGFLRVSNSGSVSVEPVGLRGLTQLAPEQFPSEAIQTRQLFVYRFPASDYAFTILADRVQPEVSINHLLLYQLSESDRSIAAEIELDIREASIRETNLVVPQDYSVVTVTGASVVDYLVATEASEGGRNLKILFGQDVQGRQLVSVRLEKSEAIAAGSWPLPQIQFPEAKVVRGDIGIVAAPGYRTTVSSSELLTEKPLSYFPRPLANLQQAFRIRQPGWNATLQIEELDRSVQSDSFHLLSLSQGVVYGSTLINYSVTGAPVAEWQLTVPVALANVNVDGQGIRAWRREGDTLFVSLQQPVMGAYTLLVTFEDKPNAADGAFQCGLVAPLGVQNDRGYVEVVSPFQVEIKPLLVSNQLLALDPLELPAEFRLLSTAPALGTWQYTQRPFDLRLKVEWFDPGTTATQVVEFAEANSRVSQDGELVTDVVYYVKSRGSRTLKLQLPADPVRLWAVTVDGRPVTARQAGDETLIPLPGSSDSSAPIEVGLRLGKAAESKSHAAAELPIVHAPVLKTQWNLKADENHVLIPSGGSVEAALPTAMPSGFEWLGTQGLVSLIGLAILSVITVALRAAPPRLLVFVLAVLVAGQASWYAMSQAKSYAPLALSLPVLASGEHVQLDVKNLPAWRAFVSWPGVALAVIGLAVLLLAISSRFIRSQFVAGAIRTLAIGLIAAGLLLQGNSAAVFFGLWGAIVLFYQLIPTAIIVQRQQRREQTSTLPDNEPPVGDRGDGSIVTASLIWLLVTASMMGVAGNATASDEVARQASDVQSNTAIEAESLPSASSLKQQWNVSTKTKRLTATAEVVFRGRPGDRFVLLRSPAVLTNFNGKDLRLSKEEMPGQGVVYVVTIPAQKNNEVAKGNEAPSANAPSDKDPSENNQPSIQLSATYEYQLEGLQFADGIPVLTGAAALQQIDLSYDEASWEVVCTAAAKIELLKNEPAANPTSGRARILLGAGPAKIILRPQLRDVDAEKTQFFVEGAQLYTPGPGVVDGKHQLKVRASQGRVPKLDMAIPAGLTVSAVEGPVAAWSFDADTNRLHVQIEANTAAEFTISVQTQRSLDALPTTVELAPVHVEGADGEVGLLALAFASEAQPEDVEVNGLSPVNLGDFDASLVNATQATLHRVYRYGASGGSMSLKVAAVSPEVRVTSKQVASLGDERIVLSINFAADITRAGIFQLSFPLPAGMEVESLTGESLHHWSELTEQGQRQIIMHLKGKTIGTHNFALTLTSAVTSELSEWSVPRFSLNEATRQSGELVVQPITGLRLRSTARQNVTEADPRAVGATGQGALAYRLLERNWSLQLAVEKLAPWVTGQVLHDVTLREGQTHSTLSAEFTVQNAAIRSMSIKLPPMGADELKTVRASGELVSDFVRSAQDDSLWELQFKRRVIGPVKLQIQYERRGEQAADSETLQPALFPDGQQIAYYYAVRVGGRLEVEPGTLTQGWQLSDWSSIPQSLRELGNRHGPAFALRALTPSTPLSLRVVRNSLADALKLRVASGALTTILSPTGDQLTSVDLVVDVIQRSSLSIQLPEGGELFSIFVNGESVHSIRQKGSSNTWQFTVLPGIDDRTAQVRLVYSLTGESLTKLDLVSPRLNVPLENIQWDVVAPTGYELSDQHGNLELVGSAVKANFDRQTYLTALQAKRQTQAEQAEKLLVQANQLLQSGEQSKAQWALGNVANRYALDAATNEDARVQLENLQTQQAVVGLNTRRQRLLLDSQRSGHEAAGSEQLRQAASVNPVLQQDQLNYRPQELSQLLAGNSQEDNATLQRMAGRLVQHQRATEPAPQAIVISLPEEGHVYSFRRSVQVAENAPLELQLEFHSQTKLRAWQWAALIGMLIVLAVGLGKRNQTRS